MADDTTVANLGQVTVSATAAAVQPAVGAFNIANFRSVIDSYGGIMRNNLFRVEIIPPTFMNSTGITNQTLTFFCEATNLPGVRINTHQVRRYGVGPKEHMPMNHAFDSLSLNIIADAQGNMLRFFRDWTRAIIEYGNEGDPGSVPSETPNRGMTALPYYVNYKQNYESQVTIVVFSPDGQSESFSMSLLHAFPTDIGDISLSWGSTDQLMTIPVRFSFMDAAYADPSPGTYSPQNNGLSIFQTFVKGVTATQSILAVLKKPQNIGDIVNSVTTTSNAIGGLLKIF